MPELWRFGPVTVADHTRDDTMAAIARRILGDAPPRFALAGLSMGGYIALEIVRQAADRVAKLALLDTGARDDHAGGDRRSAAANIALAESGRFADVIDAQFGRCYVHPDRANDAALKADLSGDVPRRRPAGLRAPAEGDHDPRRLAAAARRRSAARRWCWSARRTRLTPPALSDEMAAAIPGARLVKVPDCGHLSTMERPEAVTRELVAWMNA